MGKPTKQQLEQQFVNLLGDLWHAGIDLGRESMQDDMAEESPIFTRRRKSQAERFDRAGSQAHKKLQAMFRRALE